MFTQRYTVGEEAYDKKKNPCIQTVYIMRYNEGLKQLAQNTIKDKSYRFSATSN